MTFTFTGNLNTALDRIRDVIGDTNAADALRTDERINAAIAQYGEDGAIAWLANSLVAEFAQQPVRVTSDGQSIDYSERVKAWQQLASRYSTSIDAPSRRSFSYNSMRKDGYS